MQYLSVKIDSYKLERICPGFRFGSICIYKILIRHHLQWPGRYTSFVVSFSFLICFIKCFFLLSIYVLSHVPVVWHRWQWCFGHNWTWCNRESNDVCRRVFGMGCIRAKTGECVIELNENKKNRINNKKQQKKLRQDVSITKMNLLYFLFFQL